MKIKPTGHYVLIKPDKVEEKDEKLAAAKRMGFDMGDDTMKREQAAMTEGEVIALGPQAWKAFDDGLPWADIGDKVYFKRHVSDLIKDETDKDEDGDPAEYFLMVDENVLAVIGE